MSRWFSVLLCLSLFGCAAEGDPREDGRPHGQTTPIVNGQPPNAPHHDAVVALHDVRNGSVDRNSFCSGTLISPAVVLTAAHCLYAGPGVAVAPSALAVYFGNSPTQDSNPDFRAVSETWIHPDYFSTRSGDDLGLIRLVVPHTTTPVPALPASLGFTSADEGQLALNFAGFGFTENFTSDVKLQTDGTLAALGCGVPGCSGGNSAQKVATQISYRQPASGPCNGDSGGPAFVVRNGTVYVGGMTSYGDGPCRQYGASARADVYAGLINAFIGVAPDPDPDPDPGERQTIEHPNLSGAQGAELRFTVNISAGASNLTFAIFGGTGDADLYTRLGQAPTTSNYNCRPYLNGNAENCSVPTPPAGTYHVMLRGYRQFSGVTLVIAYDGPPSGGGPGPDPGASDFPVNTVIASIPQGQSAVGEFDVPAGKSRLVFKISEGSGDADLYVRRGAAPTLTTYDCRPYLNGNTEECVFNNPTAGTYHVMVQGYRASTNVRFQATLE